MNATKEEILTVVAAIGRVVASSANPNHYSAENRAKAERYAPQLAAARRAYARIRADENPITVLVWLRSRIEERNAVDRLLDFIREGKRGLFIDQALKGNR